MPAYVRGLYLYRELGVWRCLGKYTAYQSAYSISVSLPPFGLKKLLQ